MKKVSNTDFLESSLPKTRKEQFADILKNRIGTLFALGGLLMLFFLPMFLCFVYKQVSSIIAVANLSAEEAIVQIKSIEIITSFLLVPSAMIFSIGLAGSLKVIRRLIWGDPIFMKEDFKRGIAENFKGFLIISLLIGLLNVMCTYTRVYLPKTNAFYFIPTISCLVILYPICFIFAFVSVVYSNKIYKTFIISAKLLIRSYLVTILFALLCYAMFLIAVIPHIIQFLIGILVVIFVLPICLLMFFEYEIFLFDKFINPYQSPEYVGKGLFKSKQ